MSWRLNSLRLCEQGWLFIATNFSGVLSELIATCGTNSAMVSNTSVLNTLSPTPCTREALDAAGLGVLVEAPVQIATWRRQVSSEVLSFADEVLVKESFDIREQLKAEDVESFDPVPAFARELDSDNAELFAEDVRFLIELFLELTSANEVGIRLARLSEAMCPRFHADYIPLRMLFTYRGVGTEWLADQDADRSHLGARSGGQSDEDSGLLLPSAEIRSIPSSTVALLKGAAWPGNENKGAIHRSPAVTKREHRILLSADILS